MKLYIKASSDSDRGQMEFYARKIYAILKANDLKGYYPDEEIWVDQYLNGKSSYVAPKSVQDVKRWLNSLAKWYGTSDHHRIRLRYYIDDDEACLNVVINNKGDAGNGDSWDEYEAEAASDLGKYVKLHGDNVSGKILYEGETLWVFPDDRYLDDFDFDDWADDVKDVCESWKDSIQYV